MSKIRLIDATAFKERCEALIKASDDEYIVGILQTVSAFVDAQPTLDLKSAENKVCVPKTGEWVKEGLLCRCSECGDLWGIVHGFKFCPTCGAKMEGYF